MEPLLLQIHLVKCCDLKFSARGGLDLRCHIADAGRVEIQPDDSIVGLGIGRFLFHGQHFQARILVIRRPLKFHDPEALRIFHIVAEDRGLPFIGHFDGCRQLGVEAVPVENIVPEDHRAAVVAYEILADRKGLCKSLGLVLDSVFQFHSELGTVPQKLAYPRRVLRR